MKITFVHEVFPPDVEGGGEIIAARTVEGLSDRGHEVNVLTTGNPEVESWKGIPTKRLPVNRFLMNLAPHAVAEAASDSDIIHCTTFNSTLSSRLYSKISGKPAVCTVMGVYGERWRDLVGSWKAPIFRLVERFQVNRKFDRLLFLSEFSRRFAIDNLDVPEERADVARPGVDTDMFRPEEKEDYVLFVGRLAKQKGLDYLLEAAERIDTEFRIVGSGPEGERLKDKAPSNVSFMGEIPRQELPDIYGRSPVFCLPSVGEGLGLVIQEAMAAGCAVVSTVPLDFHGVHISPRSVDELEDGLRTLLDDRDKTREYGRRNREMVEEFTWDRYLDKVEEVYRDISQG